MHFLNFVFTPAQVDAFAKGPVHIVVDHPAYREDVELTESAAGRVARDLRATA